MNTVQPFIWGGKNEVKISKFPKFFPYQKIMISFFFFFREPLWPDPDETRQPINPRLPTNLFFFFLPLRTSAGGVVCVAAILRQLKKRKILFQWRREDFSSFLLNIFKKFNLILIFFLNSGLELCKWGRRLVAAVPCFIWIIFFTGKSDTNRLNGNFGNASAVWWPIERQI